jgi:hypothetical protein
VEEFFKIALIPFINPTLCKFIKQINKSEGEDLHLCLLEILQQSTSSNKDYFQNFTIFLAKIAELSQISIPRELCMNSAIELIKSYREYMDLDESENNNSEDYENKVKKIEGEIVALLKGMEKNREFDDSEIELLLRESESTFLYRVQIFIYERRYDFGH